MTPAYVSILVLTAVLAASLVFTLKRFHPLETIACYITATILEQQLFTVICFNSQMIQYSVDPGPFVFFLIVQTVLKPTMTVWVIYIGKLPELAQWKKVAWTVAAFAAYGCLYEVEVLMGVLTPLSWSFLHCVVFWGFIMSLTALYSIWFRNLLKEKRLA